MIKRKVSRLILVSQYNYKTITEYFHRVLWYGKKIKYWIPLYLAYKDTRPEYRKFKELYSSKNHGKNIAIIQKRVIFMNDWEQSCGIADRIKGILSTYYLTKKYNRRFYIYWTQPFPLTQYLEPSSIDWRINSDQIYYSKETSVPVNLVALKPYYTQNKIETIILKHYFNNNKELHIRTNHFLIENKASELFNELFKPSDFLQKELEKFKKNQPYFSFSFRFMQLLGDFEDVYGNILNNDDKEKLIKKCLKELSEVMKLLPEGYKAFVASDSETFLKKAVKLDSKIFCVEGEIKHPRSYFRGCDQKSGVHLKIFMDFFMIMKAERVYLLQTHQMYSSGFPKLAAIIGKKPFTLHKF